MDRRDGPPDHEVVRRYQEVYGADAGPFLREVADVLDGDGAERESSTEGEKEVDG